MISHLRGEIACFAGSFGVLGGRDILPERFWTYVMANFFVSTYHTFPMSFGASTTSGHPEAICHLTWGYLGWCSGGWCVTCVTCHTHHPSQTPLVLSISTFFNSRLQMEHLDQIFACLESRHIMHQSTYEHTILRCNMYSCVVDSIWLCLDIGIPQHLSGGCSTGISITTTDCHLPRGRSPQWCSML